MDNAYVVGRGGAGHVAARDAESSDAASSDRLDWLHMVPDVHEEILKHVSVEVTETQQIYRMIPRDESLAKYKFLVADMEAYPWLLAKNQEYRISRAKETLFRWGRLLTVTLSESVLRGRLNSRIDPADADGLCARMDTTETWTQVSKIRLREEQRGDDSGGQFRYPHYVFELVQRGHDGVEHTVKPPKRFALKGRLKQRQLRNRLKNELGLRHAVVNGVYEFWC